MTSHLVKKIHAAYLLVSLSLLICMPAFAGIDLIGGMSCFGSQGQSGPFAVTGASGDFIPLISFSQYVTVNNIFAGVGPGGTPWMCQVPDNSPDAVMFSGSIPNGGATPTVDNFYLDISTIILDNPQNPAYVDMGVFGYAGSGILHDSAGVYNDMQATFTYFTEGSAGSGFSLDTVAAVPEPTTFLYGLAGVFIVLTGLASYFRKIKG